ncbi:MAG: hypothetical protein ACOY9D_07575 [Pseudomonadota bacterium]
MPAVDSPEWAVWFNYCQALPDQADSGLAQACLLVDHSTAVINAARSGVDQLLPRLSNRLNVQANFAAYKVFGISGNFDTMRGLF